MVEALRALAPHANLMAPELLLYTLADELERAQKGGG
jgi:hypothetical protein